MINQLKNGIKTKWIKSTMDEPLDLSKKRPGPWDKQLDCEGIDISVEKGKVNIIELEELLPYMNETSITEQTFIDCKFERIDVTAEESGDESFHYYVYEFGGTYDASLISAKNFTGVQLFNEEYKTWYTEGELQMLFMLFLKEEKE